MIPNEQQIIKMIDAQFENGSIFPIEKLPGMNGKIFLDSHNPK